MLLRMSCIMLFLFFGCFVFAEEPNGINPVHRRTEFSFTVSAPFEVVAPLFGANKERLWAEGWNPQFVHPLPANDQAGAVFTVKAGHSNVWINTVYDLRRGEIQYACFTAEGMVTLIDIHIARVGSKKTKAVVVYERTALQPEANDHVNHLADGDKTKGPEWEASFRSYFQNLDAKERAAK